MIAQSTHLHEMDPANVWSVLPRPVSALHADEIEQDMKALRANA
jgi:hypothetical protein